MRKSRKPYWEMNLAEIRRATKVFDREFVPTRPLTAKERELHRRAALPGRALQAKCARRVRVSVERELLRRADAFARRQKITRSALVARGLETVLAQPEWKLWVTPAARPGKGPPPRTPVAPLSTILRELALDRADR